MSSVNSLFYWPDLHTGIREVFRVLASDGLLVLGYTRQADLDRRSFPSDIVQSIADTELVDVLQEVGFRDIRVEQGMDKYRRFSVVNGRK